MQKQQPSKRPSELSAVLLRSFFRVGESGADFALQCQLLNLWLSRIQSRLKKRSKRDTFGKSPGTSLIFPHKQPGSGAGAFREIGFQDFVELPTSLRRHLVLNCHMGLPRLTVLLRKFALQRATCFVSQSFESGAADTNCDAVAQKNGAVKAKSYWDARRVKRSQTSYLCRRQFMK